jgi:ferrous-iron efflux pump FieF
VTDPGTLVKRAAIASVAVSLFLVAIKAAAYFASHSVALLASMADSALDLFASGLNMLAIRQALTPADAEHRFGHGKAEPLAGLAQGAFIAASALFISLQAVQHIVTPEPIDNSIPALIVMCISIVSTFLLVMYQRQVVASTGSLAVDADSGHYASAGELAGLDPGRSADRLGGGGHAGMDGLWRGPPQPEPVDGPRTVR